MGVKFGVEEGEYVEYKYIGPRKHGVAHWRHLVVNGPCAAAMWPYVKLLSQHVIMEMEFKEATFPHG